MAQSKSTRSRNPELTRWSMVTRGMGDRDVLGFNPAMRFFLDHILRRFYKSQSDDTIN